MISLNNLISFGEYGRNSSVIKPTYESNRDKVKDDSIHKGRVTKSQWRSGNAKPLLVSKYLNQEMMVEPN